ncbi:phage major tail tube protein [Luteibacter sp. NPDC031894]|uniref:phage major tail tube protein n=1 Tax=Luteibacter sp. NPDC031894 TaxID=3390572 RepID=UPI003D037BAC
MSLPRVLKNFNHFQDGAGWTGETNSVTLSKLTRKMEPVINGGMALPTKVDLGMDELQVTVTTNGYRLDALSAFGATTVDAVGWRFMGAYQNDATGQLDAVEVYMRGRYSEIDPGDAKAQTVSEWKYTFEPAVYRISINGLEVIFIDSLANVVRINGVDIKAAERAALGQW